jgi:nucleoid-associated protein YgaU
MTRRHPPAVTKDPTRADAGSARRTGSFRDLGRGIAALLALAVLVLGVPAALITVAPLQLPTRLPPAGDVASALTRPDDGHLFLAALTLLAWAGWATFTLSVLVEAVAQIRGLPALRLPLLAGPQHGAALLVAAVAVMLTLPGPGIPGVNARPQSAVATLHHPSITTAPATATPPRARPAFAQEQVGEHVGGTAQPVARAHDERDGQETGPRQRPSLTGQAARRPQHPTVPVHRGDTLWGLAERHLGDGTRYTEIAALNYTRRQPDGRHLTDTHWIYPGWTLQLPADAIGTTGTTGTPPDAPASGPSVVVHPGDTLWEIAQARLGDPDRYPEIVDLNAGRPQPDGTTLTDPDVIHPGWRLELPTTDTTATPPTHRQGQPPTTRPEGPTTAPTLPRPSTASPTATASPSATSTPATSTPATSTPATEQWTAPATPGAEATAGATIPATPTGTPTPGGSGGETRDRPAAAATDDTGHLTPALLYGLGALTAAGLIAEVALRRRRQQRHRQPGRAIELPPPEATDLERRLRAAHDPTAVATLKTMLRDLAAACATTPRDLPRVVAVALAPDGVLLLLADDDDDPVPPFSAVDPCTWRYVPAPTRLQDQAPDTELDDRVACDHHADADAEADRSTGRSEQEDRPNPCPALAVLGATQGALLLVNLEAAGTLALSGPAGQVNAVGRALAVELVTSPLTESAWVTMGPRLSDLAGVVDVVRARMVDDAEAAAIAEQRRREVQRLVARHGTDDLLQLRSRNQAGDLDAPQIHLVADAGFQVAPWSGQALVTTTGPGTAHHGAQGWTLAISGSGTARLEPLGIDLYPQRLEPDTYRRVLELLATADPPPIPAPPTAPVSPPPGDLVTVQQRQDILATLPPEPVADTAAPHAAVTTSAPDRGPADPASASDGAATSAPRVLLLGSVTVDGAHDDAVPNRRRRLTELVAYLALHPGASYHEIDEALWPGQRVVTDTRNALVSRARRWLGQTPDGQPYLPPVAAEGDYRLHPAVGCDWHDFTHHARLGLHAEGGGEAPLATALALVRGRPFLGVDPRDYAWAEADTQQMISTVVDVAHVLAGIRLEAGDHRGAQHAAVRGLLAEPCSELLYRDALRAASLRGDHDEVTRLADRLQAQIERIDPDGGPEDETIELLSVLRRRT